MSLLPTKKKNIPTTVDINILIHFSSIINFDPHKCF